MFAAFYVGETKALGLICCSENVCREELWQDVLSIISVDKRRMFRVCLFWLVIIGCARDVGQMLMYRMYEEVGVLSMARSRTSL